MNGKTKVCRNNHVGFRRQLQEAESILAEEEDDNTTFEYSPLCGQELPAKNDPEVVLFSGVAIRKCHGCKGEIVQNINLLSKDFI